MLFPSGYNLEPGDVVGYWSAGPGGTKTVASLSPLLFTDGSTANPSTLALVSTTASAGVAQFATIAAGEGNTGSGVATGAVLNPQLWLQQGAANSYTLALLPAFPIQGLVLNGPFLAGQIQSGIPINQSFCAYYQQYAALVAAGVDVKGSPIYPIAWTVTNAQGVLVKQGIYGTFELESSQTQYAVTVGSDYNSAIAFQVSNDTLTYSPPESTVVNIFGLQLTITGSPKSGDTFSITPTAL